MTEYHFEQVVICYINQYAVLLFLFLNVLYHCAHSNRSLPFAAPFGLKVGCHKFLMRHILRRMKKYSQVAQKYYHLLTLVL